MGCSASYPDIVSTLPPFETHRWNYNQYGILMGRCSLCQIDSIDPDANKICIHYQSVIDRLNGVNKKSNA